MRRWEETHRCAFSLPLLGDIGSAKYARLSQSFAPYALIRIFMDFKFSNIFSRSNRSSSLRRNLGAEHRPEPVGILSAPALRRIVAEMLG